VPHCIVGRETIQRKVVFVLQANDTQIRVFFQVVGACAAYERAIEPPAALPYDLFFS
jgi:hypothetical protein